MCDFCLTAERLQAGGQDPTSVGDQAMRHSMMGDLLREPTRRGTNGLRRGPGRNRARRTGTNLCVCLRTFCRPALRFDRVCSAVPVCCVRWRMRILREIVVRECCPVAAARPRRCCCRTVSAHVPKIGRGIRDQRIERNHCAGEAAAEAVLLDRHVSNRPRTAAGH